MNIQSEETPPRKYRAVQLACPVASSLGDPEQASQPKRKVAIRSRMEPLEDTKRKMSLPSPKSPEQTDKSRKYDRQLRLWGEHGQQLLESSKICLVNATAVGCEALKSLVLPGVGGFTIADGTVVTEDDLCINFFVSSASVGKSKAAACMEGLQELNGDVHGDFVDESVDYILANRPQFFESFNLVVASNMNEQSLRQLSQVLWEARIPLIYCRSVGMYGSVRLQLKEHCVIEVHPDNAHFDLRLDRPFPGLKSYLQRTEVTTKEPWLVVLNKYLQIWRQMNGDRIPGNYREKSELRALIQKTIDDDIATHGRSHENHTEAVRAVNTAFGGGRVSSNLAALFNEGCCMNLSKQSDPFWVMVRALKQFVENENDGMLPLAGTLPDMTAATDSYITLQTIYRQQALHDAEAVYRICQTLLKRLGLPEDIISERDVRLLCREAPSLHVLRGSKLADEYTKNSHLPFVAAEPEFHGSLTELYIGLRSYERFQTEFGSAPGECYVESDTARFKSISNKLLNDLGSANTSMSDDLIHEICRYGGVEIHSVSAFIGGCVAQEAIKVLTKQYRPLDNTFLYNAITCESATMKI